MTLESGVRSSSIAAKIGSGFINIPCPPPQRGIVCSTMSSGCPISQVMCRHFNKARILGALHHALAERSQGNLRKQSENINTHVY